MWGVWYLFVADRGIGTSATTEDSMAQKLTPRQRDVLRELKRGRTQAQVATRLGLSLNTVHTHVKEIYRHFDVHSRAMLMIRCFRPPRSKRKRLRSLSAPAPGNGI